MQISRLPRKISLITGKDCSANKINILWEEGSTRENERNNTRILTTALLSEDRLCFYPMAAGKKCGVQQKLLMGTVRLRVHTDTQQQATSYSTSSFPCGVGELVLLCSRKESYPAHGDRTCRTNSENIPSQTPSQLLWLLTILYTRRACAVKPNSNPLFERAKWSQMHSRSSIQSARMLYSAIEHRGGQGGVLSAVLRRIISRYNTTKT